MLRPCLQRHPTFTKLPIRHSSNAASTIQSLLYPSDQPQSIRAIAVNGFVRSVRKQKNVAFVALGDGSTLDPLQVILTPAQAQGLSTGAAVQFTGQWRQSKGGNEQSHELHAESITLLGQHDGQSYPLQKKYQSNDFLRTMPHLRARLPNNSLLLRLRSQVISTVSSYFEAQDFVQTHPPLITSSDCEGAGEVFSVGTPSDSQSNDGSNHFFKSPKYLTVSSQLHLEALAQSVGKVWALSPTFRAEQSDTPRHLSEFYMLEAELAFSDDLNQVMDVVEQMLQAIANRLLGSRVGDELLSVLEGQAHRPTSESTISKDALRNRWLQLKEGQWPRMKYSDAVHLLKRAVDTRQARFKFPPKLGAALQAEHEKFIADQVGNGGPVFITDYPKDIKAFYMSLTPAQTSDTRSQDLTVSCFDLVVPELCEIAGGSMREHNLDLLLSSMSDHGLLRQDGEDVAGKVPESLKWYVDLRRWGSVAHGGFGLGFDRLLCYLSGIPSVRDVVTFPRWHGRCDN